MSKYLRPNYFNTYPEAYKHVRKMLDCITSEFPNFFHLMTTYAKYQTLLSSGTPKFKLYLSGNISEYLDNPEKAKNRTRYFRLTQKFFERLDIYVINPLNPEYPPLKSWEEYMLRDIALLMDCDGIFLLNSYSDQASSGVLIELATANALDLLIANDMSGDTNFFLENIRLGNLDYLEDRQS